MPATVAGAYLLGSIPSGLWLARRAGVDVRASGSGNIGATNVVRTAGWRVGLLTLLVDVSKGAVPLAFAQAAGLSEGAVCAVGVAAVAGHLLPLFGGFRGGKGVATTLGVLLFLAPDMALAAAAIFAVVVRSTRIVSTASVAAAASLPFGLYFLGYSRTVVVTGLVLGSLIVWRHRANIARLRAGTEPKLPH